MCLDSRQGTQRNLAYIVLRVNVKKLQNKIQKKLPQPEIYVQNFNILTQLLYTYKQSQDKKCNLW